LKFDAPTAFAVDVCLQQGYGRELGANTPETVVISFFPRSESMIQQRLLFNVSSIAVALIVAASAVAGGTITSGPQPGERVPGAFEPLNVTGPDAGQKSCLYCRYGTRPVVMIFARELTPQLLGLLKKLDAAAQTNDSLGVGVVFCNDSQDLSARLAATAKQNNLSHMILATYAAAGPSRYKLAPEADVTVLLYTHCSVKANHAFKKGDLSEAGSDAIVADLKLILSHD
jgi:hypothetical protein